MQQYALHPTGGQRVARGHVDGECFVPHVQKLGAFLAPVDLVGHGFPDGRPFGARRGQDVFNSELAECFDYGAAAVEPVFHGWSPRTVFLSCVLSHAGTRKTLGGLPISILEQRGRAILERRIATFDIASAGAKRGLRLLLLGDRVCLRNSPTPSLHSLLSRVGRKSRVRL